jgi:hypothetical protein
MLTKRLNLITALFAFLVTLISNLSCYANNPIISTKGAWQIIQDMKDYDFQKYKLEHVGNGDLNGEPVQYYMITNTRLDVSILFTCNNDGYPVGISTLTPKSEYAGGQYACAVLVSALYIDRFDPIYMSVAMQNMGHAMRKGDKREISIAPGKYFVCYGIDGSKNGHPNHYELHIFKLVE